MSNRALFRRERSPWVGLAWQWCQFNGVLGVGLALLGLAYVLNRYFYAELALLASVLLLTLLLLPLVNRLAGLLGRYLPATLARLLAVGLVYLLLGCGLALALLYGVPLVAEQLQQLATNWPALVLRWQQQVQDGLLVGLVREAQLLGPASQQVALLVERFSALFKTEVLVLIQPLRKVLMDQLVVVGGNTVQWLIYSLTGLVLTFYALLDGHRWGGQLARLLPEGQRQRVPQQWAQWLHLVQELVYGQALLALLGGAWMGLIFALLGLPHPGLLALAYGVGALVPYVGPWLGSLPALVILLFKGHEGPVLLFLLALLGWAWVQKTVLSPRLMPRRQLVHPVFGLLVFLLLLTDLGAWALVIYTPVMAALALWPRLNRSLVSPANIQAVNKA